MKQQHLEIIVEVHSQIYVPHTCFSNAIPSRQIPNMYEIISNKPLIGIKAVTAKKLICSANEIYGALEPLLQTTGYIICSAVSDDVLLCVRFNSVMWDCRPLTNRLLIFFMVIDVGQFLWFQHIFFIINLSNFDLVCLGNKLQVSCFLSYEEKNNCLF